jgi:hypothetical protein
VLLYDGLGPLAEQACRSIVAHYDSEQRESTRARHYSIADYLEAAPGPADGATA